MKITNGECFIIENGLTAAAKELRESKTKNLILNVIVSKNLVKISELCQLFRKEINEFKSVELVEIEKIEVELSNEDKTKKDELLKEFNTEINKFLAESSDVDFLVSDIKLSSLTGVEMEYDTSSIVGLMLSAKQ
jgi:hypothetical protein